MSIKITLDMQYIILDERMQSSTPVGFYQK